MRGKTLHDKVLEKPLFFFFFSRIFFSWACPRSSQCPWGTHKLLEGRILPGAHPSIVGQELCCAKGFFPKTQAQTLGNTPQAKLLDLVGERDGITGKINKEALYSRNNKRLKILNLKVIVGGRVKSVKLPRNRHDCMELQGSPGSKQATHTGPRTSCKVSVSPHPSWQAC